MRLFRITIDQQPWPAFLPHFIITSFTRIEIKSIVQWPIDNKKKKKRRNLFHFYSSIQFSTDLAIFPKWRTISATNNANECARSKEILISKSINEKYKYKSLSSPNLFLNIKYEQKDFKFTISAQYENTNPKMYNTTFQPFISITLLNLIIQFFF